MRSVTAAALVALSAVTAACTSERADAAPTVSRNYPVGNFDRVEVGGAFDVQIHTGAAPSVRVQGSPKLIERLKVEVKGDRLQIGTKRRSGWFSGWGDYGKGIVHITVPSLEGAALAGSGDMRIDKVSGARFEGEVAGSGDLTIASVAVKELKLGIAGSGKAEAAGRAQRAEYDIAGSGNVRAAALDTQDLEISIAGSGNVRGRATRSAKVDIAGSGDVAITGGAKCTVSKAGVGNVRCS